MCINSWDLFTYMVQKQLMINLLPRVLDMCLNLVDETNEIKVHIIVFWIKTKVQV